MANFSMDQLSLKDNRHRFNMKAGPCPAQILQRAQWIGEAEHLHHSENTAAWRDFRGTTRGEEFPGSIPAVAVRTLQVGSVSI